MISRIFSLREQMLRLIRDGDEKGGRIISFGGVRDGKNGRAGEPSIMDGNGG
jgi:hypothetical protein